MGLKIVSDGHAHGTKVFAKNGEVVTEILGICGVSLVVKPGELVTAILEVIVTEIDATVGQSGFIPQGILYKGEIKALAGLTFKDGTKVVFGSEGPVEVGGEEQ